MCFLEQQNDNKVVGKKSTTLAVLFYLYAKRQIVFELTGGGWGWGQPEEERIGTQLKMTPLAGGTALLPNCHHLGPDNAGNCISRRAGADETCCGQILVARRPLLLENSIFPQGSHEC